jgi:5'-3' exonuclease
MPCPGAISILVAAMRVHLVDGTYELFRAWFGAPQARGAEGREVGACRGLARQLFSLLRRDGATHVAVAFDHVIESFRNELFEGYKTAAGVEPELLEQFEPAEDLARALGFVVWPMVEFEADDALASGAARLVRDARVEQVLLCTPDKDLAQCLVGERVVRLDRQRKHLLDEPGVRERYGIPPAAIPDWLALVGDPADGIPGIPGWGERSASVVLAAHGSLEAIPSDPALWKARPRGAVRLAAALAERAAEARLYKRLATLRTDVPLAEGADELEWRGPCEPELERVAVRLGDAELVELAQRIAGGRST